jgi:hypothetical protein
MDYQSLERQMTQDSFSQFLFFPELQPGQWLVLEKLPSIFAYNEALLLCQVSKHEWMTWVPEYGEYLLTL